MATDLIVTESFNVSAQHRKIFKFIQDEIFECSYDQMKNLVNQCIELYSYNFDDFTEQLTKLKISGELDQNLIKISEYIYNNIVEPDSFSITYIYYFVAQHILMKYTYILKGN